MSTVNIVTSDRGWILERLAQELMQRLPYVTFGDGPDPAAAIQYYMTFACRRRRISPIEVAYFAHLEPLGEAHDRFFAVAREVEHCVSHARLYEATLREAGIAKVTTVSPGVDLETFQPKLRIGVVGRTYHTGRKGEHLVAQVMDIPEIEWSFTGEGWPGPALDLPPEALPDYYRQLDYVLVPALYEGGPMCVVEALACGTEVIAPAIGWVPEFPHVEFKVGDAADLRRVLLALVEKKRALRASVLDRTWDGWAEGHDRVFRGLADAAGLTLAPPALPAARAARPGRIGLFLHGNEARSQGGPSVRVPRLARELRDSGAEAELRPFPSPRGFAGLDLVHAFNSWAPRSALDLLRRARAAGMATVFSPIFLDIATRDLWEDRLGAIFTESEPGAATAAALAGFQAELAARRADPAPQGEAAPGFHAAVREMAGLADQLIFLSERERARLAAIGAPVASGTVVHNPVDAELFARADPTLFEQSTGLSDFVLCVARLEPRKNQLMLAHALRDTGLKLVLVGHVGTEGYRAALQRHAGPGLHIVDRLPANSPLLASAFAAARVAVLPSWSEGAPLAALEAAAAGTSLVLSDLSGESEYFGDRARYCDPGDPASIRAAVLDAYETRRTPEAIAAQQAFIADTYSWDRHRAATQDAYARAIATARARPARPPRPAAAPKPDAWRPVRIVFDVTTSAHHAGRWTGIARVEAALALALNADPRADIRFVTWNNKARTFVEVPFEAIRAGKLSRLLAHYDSNPVPLLSLPEGAHYIVPGSAWMQNQVYAESTIAFARRHRLRLTPIIHDIIPTRFPFWFNDGYAPVFEQNLSMLLDGAAHLIAISHSTQRDVEAFAAGVPELVLPEISVLREGDEIQQISHADAEDATAQIAQQFARRPFVLTVGAIHLRKNHRLLYDVWLKLAERMGPRCPHLVLVGGVAWNGHEVARALRGDPRLRDHVSILEGVDDHALDWLYRNCLFTVYPSLYEGWGLPVAESLRYGKFCIAADTSSVPEIAPGLVELLDPLDVMQWAAKVQFYAGSAAARREAEARIARDHRGVTWAQSAEQLLDLLSAAEERPRAPRPYTPGAVVQFADRFAASRFRGAGWHPCERWGCWSASPSCELIFTLAQPAEEPLVLVVEARGLALPGTVFEARVLVHGQPVTRWVLRSGDVHLLHAVIPRALAGRDATLCITLESAFLTPLPQGTKPDAPRLVGIGLAKALLAPLSSLRDVSLAFGQPPALPARAERGRVYPLLADGAGHAFLAGKWVPNPAWGMISTEPSPQLRLALQDLPGQDVEVELRLRPVATAAAPLLLLGLANGDEVGAWTFTDDAPARIRFVISAAARARAEPVAIDLIAADARAPKPLGLGASEDAFGFGLLAIEVRPVGAIPQPARITLHPGGSWRADAAVAPGTKSAFGADWHAPEPDGVWSFGPAAVLPLRLPDAAAGALLSVTVGAFQPAPGAELIGLTVAVGGRELARRSLAAHEAALLPVAVPAGLAGPGGELDLVLTVEAALSPLAAGASRDERPLGIRLASIVRADLPQVPEERVTNFTLAKGGRALAADAAALLQGDWFPPEPGGCWSRGDAGALVLGPAGRLPPGWRAFALARVFGAPAVVDIEVDGVALDRWQFDSDNIFLVEFGGLAERLAAGGSGVLGFRRRDALSPRQAGRGGDDRVLGILLLGVAVTAAEAAETRAADLLAEAGLGRHRPLRPTGGDTTKPTLPPAPAAGPAAGGDPPIAVRRYDFTPQGDLTGLRLFQWYDAEPEGRWSHGDYGEIYLTPPPGPAPKRLRIEVLARVHGIRDGAPARVELRLEVGKPSWLDFATEAFASHAVEFDIAELDRDGPELCLWFRRPDATSPLETGAGSDDRTLGLMIQTLTVTWA